MMKRMIMSCLLWGCSFTLLAGPLLFEEGKHYQRASLSIASNDVVSALLKSHPKKVQVIEFFSYACHFCAELDPLIEKWRKTTPDYVYFERIPVAFQANWQPLSKAYYVAEAFAVLDSVHPKIFSAVQKQQLVGKGIAPLSNIFEQAGSSQTTFFNTYNSFSINSKFYWANAMARAYKVMALPLIVVQTDSEIFVTGVHLAGSKDNLLKVINFLVEQAHATV